MTDDAASIPDELIARDQWVVWKGDKVPYNARTHAAASSTDPQTWSAFKDALHALSTGKYKGLGFVITDTDPYVGIDLDDCIDADGYLDEWAAPIVNDLNSYTEVTPSGRGLHIWVRGDIPAACKYIANGERIEIYPNKRYFTITGNRVEGYDPIIRSANGALHALYERCNRQDLPNVAPAKQTQLEAYTAASLKGILDDLRSATQGNRNIDLNAKAYRLGKFVGRGLIDYDEARAELESAGTALGLPLREVRATVKSGLRSGMTKASDLRLPDPKIAPQVEQYTPIANPSRFISADILELTEFEEPIWPIADILSEGVTMLAGPPKVKKSWLAMLMAYCVATGQPFLGRYDVDPGDVLFYDLESNPRRFKQRLRSMLARGDVWPKTLKVTGDCGRGDAAFEDFDRDLAAHPNTKLIIVDILARIRPPRQRGGDIYEEDYNLIQRLNALAYKHRIAIVVVHHTRKAKADHAFDEIAGSRGITGGAGASWMIKRISSTDAQLLVEGRDIQLSEEEEDGIALHWDAASARFVYAGSALALRLSDERKAILDVLSDDQPHALKDIAATIGRTVTNTQNILSKLQADGKVDRLGRGLYARIVQK